MAGLLPALETADLTSCWFSAEATGGEGVDPKQDQSRLGRMPAALREDYDSVMG